MRTIQRNVVAKLLLTCLLLFVSALPTTAADDKSKMVLVLSKNGKANASIRYSGEKTANSNKLIELLKEYLGKSTGADFAVLATDDNNTKGVTIELLLGSRADDLAGKKLLDEGYVIDSTGNAEVVIASGTELGLEYGIYEFLERYLGIKWLWPGPTGEHVPKHKELSIVIGKVVDEPCYQTRVLSGLRGPDARLWGRRSRMNTILPFHHNLFKVLPPARFARSHPEFYPVKNGKRYIPGDDEENRWQPCFSAAGSAEAAAEVIKEILQNNPSAKGFSLGVNDSSGFCQCELCWPKVKAKGTNEIGFMNYSNLYYPWVKKVIELVNEMMPQIVFGGLAYSEVYSPPDNANIPDNFIPYITYDRMKWVKPDIYDIGRESTRKWHDNARNLGWYDYIYGHLYLIPRVYFHHQAEYFRFGAENGVRRYYAEAYPNWGEGPKMYITLKLLWNPWSDVDKLLNEWCEAAVGEDAAPFLAKYYKYWEDFWTVRIAKKVKFKDYDQYLEPWKPYWYISLLSHEDIDRAEIMLEEVIKHAKTPEQSNRANFLMTMFEYYSLSVHSYLGLVCNVSEAGKKTSDYRAMKSGRYDLIDKLTKEPLAEILTEVTQKKKDGKLQYPDLNW